MTEKSLTLHRETTTMLLIDVQERINQWRDHWRTDGADHWPDCGAPAVPGKAGTSASADSQALGAAQVSPRTENGNWPGGPKGRKRSQSAMPMKEIRAHIWTGACWKAIRI